MNARPTLASATLAGCFGCHMSLLDLDERILKLVELVELRRSPLNDFKVFKGRVDIGLIEGGCANEHNVHVLRDFRRHCDVLVSMGDCATMGGVPAMRNDVSLAECFDTAYCAGPSTFNPSGQIPNDPALPRMLNRVVPCHEVVTIDHHLAGCPPSADTLWAAITALVQGQPLHLDYALLKYD